MPWNFQDLNQFYRILEMNDEHSKHRSIISFVFLWPKSNTRITGTDGNSNYGEFKSPTALIRELRKNFKLLPRQLRLLQSINRFTAFQASRFSSNQNYRRKTFPVRNLVEEKPNSSISLPTPTSNSLPELHSIQKKRKTLIKLELKRSNL